MSIYVFYSDRAAQQSPICWCTVRLGSSTAVVQVTHTFQQKVVPESYAFLKLEYQGQFVGYATRQEYDEDQKKKSKPWDANTWDEKPWDANAWGVQSTGLLSSSAQCACPGHCSLHCPNCGTLKNQKSYHDENKPKKWYEYHPSKGWVDTEIDESDKIDMKLLKKFTGGDQISAKTLNNMNKMGIPEGEKVGLIKNYFNKLDYTSLYPSQMNKFLSVVEGKTNQSMIENPFIKKPFQPKSEIIKNPFPQYEIENLHMKKNSLEYAINQENSFIFNHESLIKPIYSLHENLFTDKKVAHFTKWMSKFIEAEIVKSVEDDQSPSDQSPSTPMKPQKIPMKLKKIPMKPQKIPILLKSTHQPTAMIGWTQSNPPATSSTTSTDDQKIIELVMEQTECSYSEAIKALKNNNNDVVNAILELSM